MKSSSGKYYIGLDHVRAVAAFTVFTWHFIHVREGYLASPPIFPLSLLSEGHTGVALFMALSGYLFAKLLDGKSINYLAFVYNRFLRLAPLLFVIILLVGYENHLLGQDLYEYTKKVAVGIIKPTLPNGGWSITAEFHFYLILPIILLLTKKMAYSPVVVLVVAIILRTLLHQNLGQIQTLSFWTIIGRIDQFLLGIMAYNYRRYISGRHFLIISVLVLFAAFYWLFDTLGGFYGNVAYPSPTNMWIYLPTIEGLAYASAIAWYDNSFKHSTGRASRFIALIGTYSYSIYLWHFFVVFRIANAIDYHFIELSDIHISIFFSVICFSVMLPIGYLSYTLIESPFLKFRTVYAK